MIELEKIINYKFINRSLLKQAMTHSSHSSKSDENYERLEFLGDRVLGICVSKMLYDIFPKDLEGDLSQRYMGLVCKESVAGVATTLQLDRFIIVANEEIRQNDSLLCDICEALIGAIFVDGGYQEAFNFVDKNWRGLIAENKQPPKDAKTTLQEIAHVKSLGSPLYTLVSREGTEHEPMFYISVSFKNIDSQLGCGKNKKLAEQDAAEKMLNFIGVDYGK